MTDCANGEAPSYGDAVEQWVTDNLGHEYVDDGYHDHTHCETGEPIQTKGTQPFIKNGFERGEQQFCRGRFRLWEEDHEELIENDGRYLFVLYRDYEAEIVVVEHVLIDPEDVEEMVGGSIEWHDLNRTQWRAGRSTHIAWNKLLTSEVENDRR